MKNSSLRELRDTLPIRAFEPVRHRPVRRPFWWRPQRATGLPVVLTGGMGDSVIALGLVDKIRRMVGGVTLYSDHPGAVQDIGAYECHHARDFPGYDYHLVVNAIARFEFGRNFRGFANDAIGDLFLRYKQHEAGRTWGPFIHRHPYLDNELARQAVAGGLNRETLPHYLLGFTDDHRPFRVDYRHSTRANYITVHDGFEVAQRDHVGRATKTWDIKLWAEFVQRFRKRHKGVMVVQVGGPTSRRIPYVDRCLVGLLTLKQSFEWLWRSRLHVDGDSGLVHVARAFGVPSVVMFGPTNHQFFGYAENTNLTSGTCGDCWWLKRDWLSKCAMGYDQPKCMDDIPPARLLDAVSARLTRE